MALIGRKDGKKAFLAALLVCGALSLTAATSRSPAAPLAVVLREGLVRLVSTSIECPPAGVRAADTFHLRTQFEMLSGAPQGVPAQVLVRLGPCDIARVAIRTASTPPGAVFTQNIALRVPRGTPPGSHALRVGIVREDAPGQSRAALCPMLAPAGTVEILPAKPAPAAASEVRAAIHAAYAGAALSNLLRNGSFESGFRAWEVGEGIREGMVGWDRILHLTLDPNVAAEGRQSVRIDFNGGQDPNFFHVVQEVEVAPSAYYEVRYALKTEHITSNEGPSVAVRDPDVPLEEFYKCTPRAQRLTGTNDWTYLTYRFETGPQTRRVRLILRRDGSGTTGYDPERFGPIGGSAWFDALQLVPTKAVAP